MDAASTARPCTRSGSPPNRAAHVRAPSMGRPSVRVFAVFGSGPVAPRRPHRASPARAEKAPGNEGIEVAVPDEQHGAVGSGERREPLRGCSGAPVQLQYALLRIRPAEAPAEARQGGTEPRVEAERGGRQPAKRDLAEELLRRRRTFPSEGAERLDGTGKITRQGVGGSCGELSYPGRRRQPGVDAGEVIRFDPVEVMDRAVREVDVGPPVSNQRDLQRTSLSPGVVSVRRNRTGPSAASSHF